MRAAVLHQRALIESSPLRITEVPDPEPGPGEVRVAIRYCAVCRTDLHVIEGDLPQHKLPLIPGHQIVGRVDRLGTGCSKLKIGQRVGIAWLRSTCGRCAYCASGKENLCERSRFTGYDADGGFAEYALIAEDFCYELPEAIGDLQAVPLLCAGIIGYRAFKRSQLPAGGNLALFGFGSSAHIVIQLAKQRDTRVYVITRGAAHRHLARQLGATWVGESAKNIPEAVDSAILFAPAGELVPEAMAVLKKGGTLAVAGIHLSPIPILDYQKHLFFERDLRSVTANTRSDGIELLSEVAKHPQAVRPKTQVYSLHEVNRALQDLKADRIQGTGILAIREADARP